MTLDETIEMLTDLRDEIGHGNLPVHFSYNYGDYWKTDVAQEASDIQTGYVIHSSYHQMPKVLDEDELQRLKEEQAGETDEHPETDDEGHTGIKDGIHEVMQVVLITH
jgi:hypothetical protein